MRTRVLIGLMMMVGGFAAFPARATDGVLEINQACVAVGCFPGDGPGFPVQIVQEGAYRLTSNLVVPVGVVGGVYVASKVDLDLNGFVIRGPGSCSGAGGGVTCVGLSGYGVMVDSAGPSSVRGGTITGVSTGVDVSSGLSVALADVVVHGAATGMLGRPATISMDRVRVEQTSGSCMFFSAFATTGNAVSVRSSVLKDCHDSGIALDPGYRLSVVGTELVRIGNLGILTTEGASIRDASVTSVASDALICGDHCLVEGSQVLRNGGRGIVAGAFATIEGNDVGSNGGTAVVAGDGSTISRNTVLAGDDTGARNGIQCAVGCGVFENVVRLGTTPIGLGPNSRASRNVLSGYANPPLLGVSAGDNLCSGANC